MSNTSPQAPKSPRRSLHFVPGANERMFNKAVGLPADALILDLEDAVTPENKSEARALVCDWLQSNTWQRQEKLVRINPLESPWGREDLESVMAAKPDGIVLPKIENAAGVKAVDVLLTALEKEHGLAPGATPLVLIGTESAAAVLHLGETLQQARVTAIAWAAEDMANNLGARRKRDAVGNYLEVFRVARSLCLLSAVAAGKQPIDGPFVDLQDTAGLEQECQMTADMGYSGKLTIHPSQIDIVNRVYSPSGEEIALARELLDAFAENEKQGLMAFSFRGAMVDVPHRKRATALLERAAQIEQFQA